MKTEHQVSLKLTDGNYNEYTIQYPQTANFFYRGVRPE